MLEPQIALTAAEQRHEDLTEVLAHLRKRREEELTRRGIDLANRLLERASRRGEIGALRGEEIESLHFLLVLFDRQRVDRPHRLELFTNRFQLRSQRLILSLHRHV